MQKGLPVNITQQLMNKLKEVSAPTKSNVMIISGISGAGKNKMGDYLSRQLISEQVPSAFFRTKKMENIAKFNCQKYIQEMVEF